MSIFLENLFIFLAFIFGMVVMSLMSINKFEDIDNLENENLQLKIKNAKLKTELDKINLETEGLLNDYNN